MDKIAQIAKDLSMELTKSNLYDVEMVAVKIKSAFKVLMDDKIVTAYTEKLKRKTNQHIKINQLNDATIAFWKNKCREVFTEEQMKECYKQIDILREQLA